ncbi:hypothetical protein MAR_023830 [Mya arenaria]|uniref:Uncharacterized protein n=1 Tax=Mya arenaria TaxID=6604 RepID=A0ABY7DP41_MYAAR|nr:hypothetical protein MAR_023830 [Mya arenaria]
MVLRSNKCQYEVYVFRNMRNVFIPRGKVYNPLKSSHIYLNFTTAFYGFKIHHDIISVIPYQSVKLYLLSLRSPVEHLAIRQLTKEHQNNIWPQVKMHIMMSKSVCSILSRMVGFSTLALVCGLFGRFSCDFEIRFSRRIHNEYGGDRYFGAHVNDTVSREFHYVPEQQIIRLNKRDCDSHSSPWKTTFALNKTASNIRTAMFTIATSEVIFIHPDNLDFDTDLPPRTLKDSPRRHVELKQWQVVARCSRVKAICSACTDTR